MTLLAVVGLQREAHILARYAAAVTPSALDSATDVTAIVSIGIAGALAPDLEVGDIIIAERVVTANEAFETDARWTARLAATLHDARIGTILGRDAIADSVEVKALLHDSSRADAVDMESHIAARAAKARGIPFAALRVISDTSTQSLPPAALVAMTPDGSIAYGRVMMSVLARPMQIPELIRTGRRADYAFATLKRCVAMLGPGLGCPY